MTLHSIREDEKVKLDTVVYPSKLLLKSFTCFCTYFQENVLSNLDYILCRERNITYLSCSCYTVVYFKMLHVLDINSYLAQFILSRILILSVINASLTYPEICNKSEYV